MHTISTSTGSDSHDASSRTWLRSRPPAAACCCCWLARCWRYVGTRRLGWLHQGMHQCCLLLPAAAAAQRLLAAKLLCAAACARASSPRSTSHPEQPPPCLRTKCRRRREMRSRCGYRRKLTWIGYQRMTRK
jgi:hypothetical protein